MLTLVFRKVTGSAVCNVTSDVGSDSALLFMIQELRLVRRASRFLCCGFFGAEVLGQIIQHSDAIGVGDNGAEAFHFVEFGGPSLAGKVLLSDTAGVVAGSAGGLHLGLHGSGRKRLAGSAGRLRCDWNDGR
jgi:hypothetical protein